MKKIRQLSCHEAQQMVQPYIRGELSDDDCEAFLNHIRDCRDCYDELETYFIIYYSLKYLNDDSKNQSYDMRKILTDQIRRTENALRRRKLIISFSQVLLIVSESIVAFTIVLRLVPGLLFLLRFALQRFYYFLMH